MHPGSCFDQTGSNLAENVRSHLARGVEDDLKAGLVFAFRQSSQGGFEHLNQRLSGRRLTMSATIIGRGLPMARCGVAPSRYPSSRSAAIVWSVAGSASAIANISRHRDCVGGLANQDPFENWQRDRGPGVLRHQPLILRKRPGRQAVEHWSDRRIGTRCLLPLRARIPSRPWLLASP